MKNMRDFMILLIIYSTSFIGTVLLQKMVKFPADFTDDTDG
jgi:hypothetical protein